MMRKKAKAGCSTRKKAKSGMKMTKAKSGKKVKKAGYGKKTMKAKSGTKTKKAQGGMSIPSDSDIDALVKKRYRPIKGNKRTKAAYVRDTGKKTKFKSEDKNYVLKKKYKNKNDKDSDFRKMVERRTLKGILSGAPKAKGKLKLTKSKNGLKKPKVKKAQSGSTLKKAPAGSKGKGMRSLPKAVRNKMGYAKKGKTVKKAGYGKKTMKAKAGCRTRRK